MPDKPYASSYAEHVHPAPDKEESDAFKFPRNQQRNNHKRAENDHGDNEHNAAPTGIDILNEFAYHLIFLEEFPEIIFKSKTAL